MDPIEEKIISKYLIRFYPVIRVKSNKHFKRGIEITQIVGNIKQSTNILLNTVGGRKLISEYIIKDLIKVFGFKRTTVLKLVENYIFFR